MWYRISLKPPSRPQRRGPLEEPHVKITSAFLAACVVWAALVAPSISTSAGEPTRPRPDVMILERLKDVGLSGAQTAAIKKLSAELDSRLGELEAKAAPTPAQRAARERALRKVIAEGKRGTEARPIIAAAFALSNEQRHAAAQIGIVRDEFNRSVFSLLTETQKRMLAASEHRLDEFTGFIIVRLAGDVPREARRRKKPRRRRPCAEPDRLARGDRRLGIERYRAPGSLRPRFARA